MIRSSLRERAESACKTVGYRTLAAIPYGMENIERLRQLIESTEKRLKICPFRRL